MPRKAMDYSKTVIYKIHHTNDDTLIYVGHTTDFVQRKSMHKSNLTNINSKNHTFNLYTKIRENGGWDMFRMVEIKKFPCNDSREAEEEEEEDKIIRELNATMNTRHSYRTSDDKKEYDKTYNKKYAPVYYEKNKDKINERRRELFELYKETVNARRRELYRLKKEKENN